MLYSKIVSSPFGFLYLVANENALVSIDNLKNELYLTAESDENHAILNATKLQLNEYFNRKRNDFDIPILLQGSPFQQKVWSALKKIPIGEVWSYGEQAKYINAPKASRAVGAANGKNPLPIIIPCHRVIGSTGKITGYNGGIEMKIELLKLEGHKINGLQVMRS